MNLSGIDRSRSFVPTNINTITVYSILVYRLTIAEYCILWLHLLLLLIMRKSGNYVFFINFLTFFFFSFYNLYHFQFIILYLDNKRNVQKNLGYQKKKDTETTPNVIIDRIICFYCQLT